MRRLNQRSGELARSGPQLGSALLSGRSNPTRFIRSSSCTSPISHTFRVVQTCGSGKLLSAEPHFTLTLLTASSGADRSVRASSSKPFAEAMPPKLQVSKAAWFSDNAPSWAELEVSRSAEVCERPHGSPGVGMCCPSNPFHVPPLEDLIAHK